MSILDQLLHFENSAEWVRRMLTLSPRNLWFRLRSPAAKSWSWGARLMYGRYTDFGLTTGIAVRTAMQLTDTAELAGRVFNELSGGERQRAVLAMALAQEPEILLLDEPTQQLDITRQAEILDLVGDLNVRKNLTVVAAMHDLNLAGHYFNRLVVLHRGMILADGTPQAVLSQDVIANA